MRLLTVLFVLMISVSVHAKEKLVYSYILNGPAPSLNVAVLSDKFVVQKVVSKELPNPGGLTSIQLGTDPLKFSVYYNHRIQANGPIKISRDDFEFRGNDLVNTGSKILNQKCISFLNFNINDGIGSVQVANNSVNRFALAPNQTFRNMKRDILPGQPTSSSQVKLITPSGANEFHGSLLILPTNPPDTGVFFRKVIEKVRQQPRIFRFSGPDRPRNMILARGCGRKFFFASYEKLLAQGGSQIAHKRQELSDNFDPIGTNFLLDGFRNHRNPAVTVFNTLAATVDERGDGTCRMYTVSDRFNTAKNRNEFHGSIFTFEDRTALIRRSLNNRRLNLPIPNNSAAYGTDVAVVDVP